MDLGKIIRLALIEKGISQKDLAEYMDSGTSAVSDWCQDKKTQRWHEFIKLAEYLDIVSEVFPSQVNKKNDNELEEEVKLLKERVFLLEKRMIELLEKM